MNSLATLILVMAGIVIYFLPSIVASQRDNLNFTAIFLINLFLGWTFVGWVGALVWAFL